MGWEIFDGAVLIMTLIITVFLVWRFNLKGVILGTLFIWAALFLEGVLLNHFDEIRDTGVLDSIWMLFGWVYGLLYCGGVYVVKVIAERIRGKN